MSEDSGRPADFETLLANVTPEVHQRLRTAVELGRWESGERLSPEQVENCLQLIIAWEYRNLQESERVAWIDRSGLKERSERKH